MQCGYYRNLYAFLFKNLFCHVCSRCMWYGIVNMQELHIVINNHIYHCAGQSSFIRGIIEQRISRYSYFMIKNVCMKSIQAYGLLVSNEMYVVAFICQGLAKFCSQYSASAVSRIANNSYIHNEIILILFFDIQFKKETNNFKFCANYNFFYVSY